MFTLYEFKVVQNWKDEFHVFDEDNNLLGVASTEKKAEEIMEDFTSKNNIDAFDTQYEYEEHPMRKTPVPLSARFNRKTTTGPDSEIGDSRIMTCGSWQGLRYVEACEHMDAGWGVPPYFMKFNMG